jgi:hypothetical protein
MNTILPIFHPNDLCSWKSKPVEIAQYTPS